MTEQPQTWHYGLIARWWAEFNVAAPEEIAFYSKLIERFGQPALDLACGAGRILMPLLALGLDVEGCDISPDMLARCREKAESEGFAPALYQQAMHEIELQRTYRTIYICDSFGLGGRRDWDAEALRRCHSHLASGGALAFSHYLPYEDVNRWSLWMPGRRRELPEAWPETGGRKRTGTGDEIELCGRVVDLDPLEQRLTMQMRASLWHDGTLVAEEEYALQENLYFRNEILLLLKQAGFENITVHAGYTGRTATADDVMLVFVARAGGASVEKSSSQ